MQRLFGSYYYDIIQNADFESFREQRKKIRKDAYKDFYTFNTNSILSKKEQQLTSVLQKNVSDREKLFVLVYHNKKIIGYHFGIQKDENDFLMGSSGIMKAHRGKGIYTKLLDVIVNTLAKKGYQRILSRHHLGNNAVLIPKLKKGFLITGLGTDPTWGTLVDLVYFTNKKVRRAFEIRVGSKKPTSKEKKEFGL